MAHVAILGGGFGGLAAAHELRSRLDDDHQITLVDRSASFFMGFAKLWDLGDIRGIEEGTGSLTKLDEHGVRFLQAEVTAVDPAARRIETTVETLEVDALLVALGAGFAPPHLDMLGGEGAHNLYDAAALPAMKRDLDAIDGGRVVVSILGGPFLCPPAPYEATLLMDEKLRQRGVRDGVEITVTTPQPITLPVAGKGASEYVARHLLDRDVDLRAETKVAGVDGQARTVSFADGTELDYTLLFGVPAASPPPVLEGTGLLGDSGWIEPDRHTLRTGFERVYAVGDCTHVPTPKGQLPKAGVFAAGEAEVAARNLVADLVGGDEARFDGHGYCFLELPGEQVAFVEGNFYAEPEPDVEMSEADAEQFRRKQAFERERLDAWLG